VARIFINYRREDSEIWAARLEDALKRAFPADVVFRDVTAIAPGADFVTALETALRETAAAVVVIGPSWLSVTDKKGHRRLEQPGDFVRQEVAACLARDEVRVFPVLVQGAEMPGEDDLPEPLKPLWRRHALDLTVRHWDQDVAQLVQRLKEVPGLSRAVASGVGSTAGTASPRPSAPPGSPPAQARKLPLALAAIVAAGIAAAIAVGVMGPDRRPDAPPPRVVEPAPAPAASTGVEATPAPRTATRPATAAREPAPSTRMPPVPAPREPAPRAETPAPSPAREPVQPQPPAAPVTLRGQDTYGKALGFSDNLAELASTVQSLSDGRVKLDVLPAGTLVSAVDAMDAVANGTLDFAWVAPGQFARKDLAFALIDSPPFGPAPAGYLRWRTDPAAQLVIDRLYGRHGVRALPCGAIWLADLWTNLPLRNASDLRGRKVRTSSSLNAEIFKRVGATPYFLPGGEVVTAIERGVVESVQLLDPASGVRFRLHEYARALYFPGRLSPAGGIDLLINPAKWAALDPAARRVVEQACERNARQMVAAGSDAQKAAMAQVALRGIVVEALPADVQDALRRAWREVAAEAGTNPTIKQLTPTLERYETGGR
jgi:TRAP-type mannitol/chloroaromatic compound transport system substrate-binding protein